MREFPSGDAFSVLHRHVTALADRIGYRGTVRLGLTDRITGPMLVGHLKPVLLFPVAMVNQLTTEEAETVILHELAHLRRADHLFHLLQCLLEVLFYYHPAIHWIGARIREEREHCCDDLVLRYGPGKLPYARALLYFSEQSPNPVATALSLTDGGGLLARVRRFIDHQETKYTMKSRLFILPILAVATFVGTAAYAPADKAMEAPLSVEIPSAPALAAPDTLPPARWKLPEPPPTLSTKKLSIGSDPLGLDRSLSGFGPEDLEQHTETLRQQVEALASQFDKPESFIGPNHSVLDSILTRTNAEVRPWNRVAGSEADWFRDIQTHRSNFDSLTAIYERGLIRLNIDSLIEQVTLRGESFMVLDSFSISWDKRIKNREPLRSNSTNPTTPRLAQETDLEYVERQEKELLQQLLDIQAQKKVIQAKEGE